jgi:RNA polymerase sigma factor (sigma-70 family)
MAAFGRGEPEAAAALVRRFQGRVYGLAVSITHDAALAEDVAQEAFVRAWKSAPTYDARRGSLVTWLLTITRNVAIDAMRARRDTPASPEILDEVISHSLRDPTGAHADRLVAQQALRALMATYPDQARAVVLAVLGGCTAQQVSDHEGIPLGTAKTRIRTGLARMRATAAGAALATRPGRAVQPLPLAPLD